MRKVMRRSWTERERCMLYAIQHAVTLTRQPVEPETAHNCSVLAVKMVDYMQTERERDYIEHCTDVKEKIQELIALKKALQQERQYEKD